MPPVNDYSESVGTFDRLWLSPDGVTWSAVEFLDGSGMSLRQQFTNPAGTRGTRVERAERTRETMRQATGTIRMAPNPAELDLVLAWAIGPKAANTFAFTERPPARVVGVSRDGVPHAYPGCFVQAATFAASEGGMLTADLQLAGTDEIGGGTLPVAAIPDALGPYVMADCVLSVGGTAIDFRSLSVTIENMLDVKFNQSLTPSTITAAGLRVSVSLTLPYGDASALYGSGLPGVVVTATFVNVAKSFILSFPCVQAPKSGLPLGGKRARDFQFTGEARKQGTDPIFTITNIS